MLANGTIVDIYRKAQTFAKDPKADKSSLHQAVNVARFMHPLPDIVLTKIGTAELVWQKDNVFFSLEFFPNNVNITLAVQGATDQVFTGTQYHSGSIPINILFVILQQFCFMVKIPAPKINPWDEFGDTYFEDINLDDVKEREDAAEEEKTKTFLSFKKIKTDIKEDDNVTSIVEEDNDLTVEEEDNDKKEEK